MRRAGARKLSQMEMKGHISEWNFAFLHLTMVLCRVQIYFIRIVQSRADFFFQSIKFLFNVFDRRTMMISTRNFVMVA